MKKIVTVFMAALVGGVLSVSVYDWGKGELNLVTDQPLNNSQNTIDAANPQLAKYLPGEAFEAPDLANAAEASVNAVVHVKSTMEGQQYYQVDPFRYFFYGDKGEPIQGKPQIGFGSGVIISDDGYIVTNNHVVQDAEKVEVILNDKRSLEATVIGTDPSTDIALLKIDEENLPVIPYGNSDELRLGEWVLAVGNPFNLTSTVTAGIVSAKGRNLGLLHGNDKDVVPIESFIQTDAAVNKGNSGGALVNAQGQLVGINTAIKSETGSYAGYSFAVPVNIVSKVVDDLLEYGAVQRAFIGVSIKNIDGTFAAEEGVKTLSGAYVAGLMKDGAAEEAGIEKGDVIVKVGDVKVKNVAELQEQVSRFRPGNKVVVTVLRGDEELEMQVVLTNKFGGTDVVEPKELMVASDFGATFKDISDDQKKKLDIDSGLQIESLNGGKLRSAGIKEGFIITHVDKKEIKDYEDFKSAVNGKAGGVLIEGIYPNGMRGYYGLGL